MTKSYAMRTPLTLLAFGLLTACTAPISQQDTVHFAVTGAQAAANVERLDQVTVRSFERVGLRRTEITGLSCTAVGTGLRATFTSPATLAVPTYLGRTDAIDITCQRRGEPTQSATRQIKPINATADELDTGLRIGVSSNDGLDLRLGLSIRDRSRDRFDYPATVILDFPARS